MSAHEAGQAILARIEGRVQGVGYRDWTVGQARALGLSGWVRNLADGRVEALFHGSGDAVGRMLEACRRGPPAARVAAIETVLAEAPSAPGFARLRDG